ncbi:MAG: hypothetical protein PHU71_04785 [Candidatus Gracilibacteria bacterium]|nr:hypothetical protein [Candidatus Gracilibacteria bacterium]
MENPAKLTEERAAVISRILSFGLDFIPKIEAMIEPPPIAKRIDTVTESGLLSLLQFHTEPPPRAEIPIPKFIKEEHLRKILIMLEDGLKNISDIREEISATTLSTDKTTLDLKLIEERAEILKKVILSRLPQ